MANPLQGVTPLIQPANVNIPIQSGDMTEAIFKAGQLALQQRELQRQSIQGVTDTFLSLAKLHQESIRTQLEHQVASATLEQAGTTKFFNPFKTQPGDSISGAGRVEPVFDGMPNLNAINPKIGELDALDHDIQSTLGTMAGHSANVPTKLWSQAGTYLGQYPDLKQARENLPTLGTRFSKLMDLGEGNIIVNSITQSLGSDAIEDAATYKMRASTAHAIITKQREIEVNKAQAELFMRMMGKR